MTMTRRAFNRLTGSGLAAAAATGLARPAWVAAQEKITLRYLSVARGEPRRQAILQVVERFEKANPTIKVELSEVPFDQYFQKVSVSMAAGSGVDAFDVDSPLVASYGHQDVLLPLDEYAKAYGWDKSYTPETMQQFMWSDDGQTFGEGTLWGVAQTGARSIAPGL